MMTKTTLQIAAFVFAIVLLGLGVDTMNTDVLAASAMFTSTAAIAIVLFRSLHQEREKSIRDFGEARGQLHFEIHRSAKDDLSSLRHRSSSASSNS